MLLTFPENKHGRDAAEESRPYAGKSFEQLLALAERVESQRVELAREQELIRDELRFRNLNVAAQPGPSALPLPAVELAYATPPMTTMRDDAQAIPMPRRLVGPVSPTALSRQRFFLWLCCSSALSA